MRSRFICSLIVGFFLFLFTSPAIHAMTFYVSPSGNDSRDGETESTAWKTIQHAVTQKNTVRPGDTILILPGTYRESVVMNGSTQNYEGQPAGSSVEGSVTQSITIKGSQTNNPPVITNGEAVQFQWLMIDVSHINIENIKFENYYNSGFKVIAENEPVTNVHVRKLTMLNQRVLTEDNVGWQGRFAILFSAADFRIPITHVSLRDSYLDNIVTRRPSGDGHECIRLNGEVNYAIVENNTIGKCTNLGIDILGLDRAPNFVKVQPNYIVLRNNTITGMYKYVPNWVATPTAIYFDRAGNYILVENNKIISNGESANAVKTNVESYDGNLDGFGDIIIRGNLKVGKGPTFFIGIGTNNDPDPDQFRNNKFMDRIATAHNTSVNTDTALSSTPITYTGSRFTVTKNNVFSARSTRLQFFPDWLTQYPALNVNNRESNGNLWYTTSNNPLWYWGPNRGFTGFSAYTTGSSQDRQSLYVSPQFVNTSAQNYQLKSGTPGHNQGIDLTKTTAPGTNTRTVPVEDTKYFYDGWGIEGEVGDKIMVGSTQVRITNVNHATKTLTVDRTITYANNTPVNYYYEGSRPTMGLLPVAFYDKGDVTTTPTPTPTGSASTPTPPSCPSFSSGNATCDSAGTIDLTDFTCWKGEFLTGTAPGGCPGGADFDTSGSVDILDFTIWQVSYARG